MAKKEKKLSETSSSAPVITVLGHVDHGKTSLLDAIRKTNVVAREHGGITQKIGASQVQVGQRKITFIDTPGHEAFMKMRGRGVQVADIGLLVVSAVDGVMPQTKESIQILKEAKIPYIVVLTKSDVPEKNVEKIKGQLLKEEVLIEGQGGDVPVIEVSSKTGSNIKELLDLILLVWDMHPFETSDKFKGVIIESKMDHRSGPKATLIVKSGKLSLRDEIVAGDINGRTRTLINDKGDQLKEVSEGDAIEILGFEKTPEVGSVVYKRELSTFGYKKDEEEVQKPKEEGKQQIPETADMLRVIICADTYGSLEAINGAVSDKLLILSQKTGDVEPSDIMLAKSSKAIILGFNTRVRPEVQKLAEEEKVLIRNYNLIYEMIAEIEDFLEGKRLSLEPKILGKAKIMALFPFDKKKVLGIQVLEGRVAKGDKIQLVRNEEVIGETSISSVRQGKNQISKVEAGQEAGILPNAQFDFRVGDVVISQG